MEFKIDTRLPLEVFRKVPFIYTGPDFNSFPGGMISSTMNYQGRRFRRFCPLTVSKFRNGLPLDQMFCFSFFYVTDAGGLVLFLTNPYHLIEQEKHTVIDFFLTKVEEFARLMNSEFIEVEFHDEIKSSIAFPTSLSHFSYDLSGMCVQRDDLSLFQLHGFRQEVAIVCYEQSTLEVEERAEEERHTHNHVISSIDPSKFVALRKVDRFVERAYALSSRDPAVLPRSIPFFRDAVSVAYRRSRWFRIDDLAGFLRWSPNLLEPLGEYRSPVPLLFHYVFENYPFKCGKILDWGLGEGSMELFTSLLHHASHSMRQKGLEKCQIAYISDDQSSIKAFLEQLGFKRVHTIKLLRKRLR